MVKITLSEKFKVQGSKFKLGRPAADAIRLVQDEIFLPGSDARLATGVNTIIFNDKKRPRLMQWAGRRRPRRRA